MKLRRRATELTELQREALDQARQILQPYFAGESIRLQLPKMLSAERQSRQERIVQALRLGEDPHVISRREDVSLRLVRLIRISAIGRVGRIGGKVRP